MKIRNIKAKLPIIAIFLSLSVVATVTTTSMENSINTEPYVSNGITTTYAPNNGNTVVIQDCNHATCPDPS